MKVNVIKDKCIGCGNCVALTEGMVFDFNDDGLASVVNGKKTNEDDKFFDIAVDDEMEENVRDAVMQCPTEAIVVDDNKNE